MYYHRVRGTRTQPLVCVGYSVQIIREAFSRLHLCRHTFASLWGGCSRFASFWRANSCGDSCVLGVHLSNVCWGLLFVFVKRTYFNSLLKVYYRSVFVESFKAFNTLSKILPWIKPARSYFYHVSSLKAYIFQEFAEGLLSMRVCWIFQNVQHPACTLLVHASMEPGLFSSAAVVPQSKSTELCSSAAVVPQSKSTELCSSAAVVPNKVNLPSCVVARRPLFHDVNLSSCVARRLLCHTKEIYRVV